MRISGWYCYCEIKLCLEGCEVQHLNFNPGSLYSSHVHEYTCNLFLLLILGGFRMSMAELPMWPLAGP